MEKKSNSMLKHSMNYGLIMGVSLVILSLIIYLMGILKPPFWVSIINWIIVIAIIYIGSKKYRDEVLGGAIGYGNAVGYGVLVSAFSAVITSFFTVLLVTVIDPEYVNKLLVIVEEEMVNKGLPDEQISAGLEMSKKFMSPIFMFFSGLLGSVLTGLVISLITSIFVKKEAAPFKTDEVIE